MAGNVQFVFFRKKGSDDILVKVLLNEHEMKLPVESELAPYYHWKDVEAYYRNELKAYGRYKLVKAGHCLRDEPALFFIFLFSFPNFTYVCNILAIPLYLNVKIALCMQQKL